MHGAAETLVSTSVRYTLPAAPPPILSSTDPARSATEHEPAAAESGAVALADAVEPVAPGEEASGPPDGVLAEGEDDGEDDDGDCDDTVSPPPDPQPATVKRAPKARADTDEDFHNRIFIALPCPPKWGSVNYAAPEAR